MTLPAVPSLKTIKDRLVRIFPEGTENRNYVIREVAAKLVFVAIYIGAVEGQIRWFRPNQVVRMSHRQATRLSEDQRLKWADESSRPRSRGASETGWYKDTSREQIRDETIRVGLMPLGCIVERPGVASTSSIPRYSLAIDFAELFYCGEGEFEERVQAWQEKHLSAAARARIALVRRGIAASGENRVTITFPNGEGRLMQPGPSSIISKAVIETFSRRFLQNPGVVWLSESRERVVARDDKLATEVGLTIAAEKLLPDIILVDLGPDDPLLVFVEVVASDGPVTEKRKNDLLGLIRSSGHMEKNAAFVTALLDRGVVYRKVSSQIAWGSLVWFASEPERIIIHRDDTLKPSLLSWLAGIAAD